MFEHPFTQTTVRHGDTNLNVLIYILIITSISIWNFGKNYLVIFCSGAILHMIIEAGLSTRGIRKGSVYVYNKKLLRAADVALRSLVEGPAFCVPAYFVADQFNTGSPLISILFAASVVGFALFYLGWMDRLHISKLTSNEKPLVSKRAMTKPGAVMMLALINSVCIAAMFLIPSTHREHAFTYLLTYSGLVLFFYLINYNLGVRYIEMYDHESKTFKRPGLMYQTAGLTWTARKNLFS